MKTLTTLTADKFKEIYTSEKFRNEVAYAHQYADKTGKVLGRKTCAYPNEYYVTEEQVAQAQEEVKAAKVRAIEANKGKLLFVGMGMTYEPKYEGDPGNHRIRTEFQNPNGRRFFIELGTGAINKDHSQSDRMRIDYAIDRTRQDELKDAHDKQSQFYNYKGLEMRKNFSRYHVREILKLVNDNFDCNFSEMVVDNYNLSTEDFIAVSPAFRKEAIHAN